MNAEPASLEPGSLRLSVVVPVLNEISALPGLALELEEIGADQIVIVDGGSEDGTFEWLELNWSLSSDNNEQQRVLLKSSPGRARQMNCGAQVCCGNVIVFLHADTVLPIGAKQEILQARQRQRLWGRFDVSFSSTHTSNRTAMRVIAFFINWRSRLTGIATGDQAIFVDADLFKLFGGYTELPLMEDVSISKQLKQYCKPYCSRMEVVTSDRRWQENGVIKTVLMMWGYRLAFFLGVSAERLAGSYRNVR